MDDESCAADDDTRQGVYALSDLEKAARQALESIEQFLHCCVEKESDIQRDPVLTDLDNAKTALCAALAHQTKRVLTEVDPISGITFKATLKFDPVPVQAERTWEPLGVWTGQYVPPKSLMDEISFLIGKVEGGK